MPWLVDPIDPDDARRRAAEILAGDAFKPADKTFFQRGLDWLGRQLGKLLDLLSFGGSGAAGSVIGWAVVLAALALLVVLVVRGMRRGRRPKDDDDADMEPVAVVAVERSGGDWRAEAAEHAAAGRWREALRCRYRAVVADLTAQGTLDAVPGRTTGEERRQVAERAPALGAPFEGVADVFDRVVYGDEPAGPADVAAVDALDRDVSATRGSGR